jgi:N-carbamoyl-L-amino-acid hydrolase
MIEIDADRLLDDLRRLAAFGRVGTGVDRIAFSAVDMQARRWLAGRMTEAGLVAHIDNVGNVLGRSTRDGPAVLIGSHTDTVPRRAPSPSTWHRSRTRRGPISLASAAARSAAR